MTISRIVSFALGLLVLTACGGGPDDRVAELEAQLASVEEELAAEPAPTTAPETTTTTTSEPPPLPTLAPSEMVTALEEQFPLAAQTFGPSGLEILADNLCDSLPVIIESGRDRDDLREILLQTWERYDLEQQVPFAFDPENFTLFMFEIPHFRCPEAAITLGL